MLTLRVQIDSRCKGLIQVRFLLPPRVTRHTRYSSVDSPRLRSSDVPYKSDIYDDSGTKMASIPASTQVGQTVVLIKLILSFLPLPNIAKACGINKTFRNTILNSVTLRKKLFLSATDASPQYWLPLERYIPTNSQTCQTLFRAVTVDADSLIFEPTPKSRTHSKDLPLRVVSTCPLLERPSEAQGSWARYETSFDKLQWNQLSTSPNQWFLLPTKHITGPWKRMFLTNPPCKSVRCTLLCEGWVHGVLDITLEATRHVYRQAGVTFADLIDDTCSMLGSVVIHTACDDEHWLTVPRKGGGYICKVPMTTLHEQIERCKKNNDKREMRLNNHSTVALLWTVALIDQEHNELAAKVEDKFFFSPTGKAVKPTYMRRTRQ